MNALDGLFYQLELAFGKDRLGEFEIVKNDENLTYPLLHISSDPNIKHFFPRFSHRQIPGEDTSIPRLSTGRSLVGCILGLCSMNEFGMFVIYTPKNWTYAVIPSKKLLPDIEYTNEHWVLSTDVDNRLLPTEIIGQFYMKSHEHVWFQGNADGDKRTVRNMKFYAKLGQKLEVIDGELLTPGYYEIQLHGHIQPFTRYELGKNCIVRPITEKEFTFHYSSGTHHRDSFLKRK